MKKIAKTYMFLIGVFLISCRHTISSRDQLIEYISKSDNGLIAKDSIGKMTVTLSYLPWQMLLKNTKTDAEFLRSVKKRYNFILSLSANHKELLRQLSFRDYSFLIQKLSFEMSDYITLSADASRTVIHPQCQLLQTYGAARANEILVTVDRSSISGKELKVRIKDFGLGFGEIYHTFKICDIKNIEGLASL